MIYLLAKFQPLYNTYITRTTNQHIITQKTQQMITKQIKNYLALNLTKHINFQYILFAFS